MGRGLPPALRRDQPAFHRIIMQGSTFAPCRVTHGEAELRRQVRSQARHGESVLWRTWSLETRRNGRWVGAESQLVQLSPMQRLREARRIFAARLIPAFH